MGGYTASDAARVATPSAVCRVSHRDRRARVAASAPSPPLLRSGIHRDPPIARASPRLTDPDGRHGPSRQRAQTWNAVRRPSRCRRCPGPPRSGKSAGRALARSRRWTRPFALFRQQLTPAGPGSSTRTTCTVAATPFDETGSLRRAARPAAHYALGRRARARIGTAASRRMELSAGPSLRPRQRR